MKKKKNIIFAFLLIFVVLFNVNVAALQSQSKVSDDILAMNYDRVILAGEIMKELADNDIYPDYFGGIYISDDSKYVILQIVKDEIQSISEEDLNLLKKYSLNDKIQIKEVSNSYKELENVYNSINNYYKKYNDNIMSSNLKNYAGHYIDVINNRVVFEFLEEKDIAKSIETIKSEITKSNVIYYTRGEMLKEEQDINAGGAISVNGGTCSMGYRARINGNDGYVTAAHCTSYIGENIASGTVTKRYYGGELDAAFIQTNSSFTPKNTLDYSGNGTTYLNNTMCPTLIVGGAIAHVGVSSHYKAGNILSLSATTNYNGVSFYNLGSADYISAGGDSGGPVFVPNSSVGGLVAGIHRGSKSSTVKLFIKETAIYNAMGYSRY
jgi:hypothetical protein